MSLGLVYWILMLVWFVFGLWTVLPVIRTGGIKAGGGDLLLFILLLVLGWQVFGAPIHG
jgi:hypothetical protein